MSTKEETLEAHLKRSNLIQSLISIFAALVIGIGAGYGWYYQTSTTLKEHTTDIQTIRTDVTDIKEELSHTQVFQGMTETEQKNFNLRLTKMEEKMDKILELLIEIRRK